MASKIISVAMSLFLAVMMFTGCGEDKDAAMKKSTDDATKKVQESVQKTVDTLKKTVDTLKSNVKEAVDKIDSAATGKTPAGDVSKKSDGNMVMMETSMGKIKIKLYTDKAPITTGNFKKLINEGFYNGIKFHRVIDGFMIQGGDPSGNGTGGSKETIKDEFGPGLKHNKKGILSMANRGPNTGSSQFFITLAPTDWLDGKHAIFGEVVEGMDVVDKIGKVKTGPNDKPEKDVVMTKVYMLDK
jgi:peptidyl-prolyl cis-trans isomerase A (cyclophilin A)